MLLVEEIRGDYESAETPIVVSGCVGPRVDGYVAELAMSGEDAEAYHRAQIDTLAGSTADLVTAVTLGYAAEAVGVARAARRATMPVVVSFTVETDGRLPSGQALGDAIGQVDDATSGYPLYFMVNCAHPSHFDHVLDAGEPWVARIGGLRPNASRMSHAEMDEALRPDAGDPAELGRQCAALKRRLSQLTVMGGCCGTDQRHIAEIARRACLTEP